ncbi:heme ABC transporter ATP-binding protein [Nocardia sp. BMG111209]|uniref:heme ABC transporter ATP-binding protein n=1 Tax=Nocardia sp. BMG111209 TaxID=1160137 RepID=UPI000381DB39|nr:heme ABC transporter ATP-binding protein [Nocardia sp. BMG111209]
MTGPTPPAPADTAATGPSDTQATGSSAPEPARRHDDRNRVTRAWRRIARRTHDVPPAPDPGTITLRARGVTITRGGRPVLEDVDLEVVSGQILALVGPNGAGKSTLLAALAGELDPICGSVELDGRPLTDWTHTDMARRRAVLPQSHSVGFPFTAREVVTMGRAPWARTARRDGDEAAIAAAMAATDVGHLADRPFPALSGGERARVALARVLAQDTHTMMLDEPTAALDLGHQEQVLHLARRRAHAGAAVVVVLHDLGVAAAYADRVAVLADGRLVAAGPPRDVLTTGLLTDVYRHPVEVFDHPRTGTQLVLPVRR